MIASAVAQPTSSDSGRTVAKRAGPRLQWLATPWRAFVAVVMTQAPVLAILLLGCLYRLMQRQALRYWWRRADARGASFREFLGADATTRKHLTLPNFFLAQNRQDIERNGRYIRSLPGLLSASLWQNLRTGFAGILTLWAATFPGAVLMLFAWYDGWNNSFNKGYENAPVGPLTGILGIVLFATAAAYVPIAQARQAACDDWRTFFEVRTNLRLLRGRAFAALALTAGYLAASVPVTLVYTSPGFLPQMDFMTERYQRMTDAEVLAYIKGWYFWGGALFVALLIVLKRAGAHLYAGAVLRGLARGSVRPEALHPFERAMLTRLGLWHWGEPSSPSRLASIAVTVVLVLPWIAFTAEIFIAQFFTYQGIHGWLNQPLVQLPWMNYVPP